jgi:rhodanese-related sulfurtransferase
VEEIKSKDITAEEFQQKTSASDSVQIIDVREVLEFRTFNLGGDNIPLGILMTTAADLEYDKEKEIIVICQRGLRSKTAKLELQKHGYKNVRNLTGGILALRKINN